MKSYNTYLFDGDGTLYDTADLVVHCFQYVAGKYRGISVSRDVILSEFGLPLRGQLEKQLGNEADIEAIHEDFIRHQMEFIAEDVRLFPGVWETLNTLKKSGKKLAVVTSRKPYSLKRILELTDIAQFFDTLVTPDDTTLHKPDPAPTLLALSRMGRDASETVFVGDSQYDILSGDRAGTDTVFVNWSHLGIDTVPICPTWRIDKISDLVDEIQL